MIYSTAPLPDLPLPGTRLANDPHWRYPSRCAGGFGYARLRVWAARSSRGDGILAAVTELGEGVSITNAITEIWEQLTATWRGELWLLEHWPASQAPGTGEHLDQAAIGHNRRPQWARIWPTTPANPHHQQLDAWIAVHGTGILTTQAPPPGPGVRDD